MVFRSGLEKDNVLFKFSNRFLNPTIEDKNKYLIISEYWEQNKNKTDLFILNFS